MKLLIPFVALILPAIYSAISTSDPIISSWVQNTAGTKSIYGKVNINAIYYDSSNVYVKADGLPSYSIGPWKNNPNTPSSQGYVYKYTQNPSAATGTKRDISTELGPIGSWTNGVPIFNAYDGYTAGCNSWHRNAYMYEGDSFDSCNGHADSKGAYHNHINPACLYTTNASTVHSPIIGWSFDGYPVYGPYGYTNKSNPASAIKRIVSSYQTRSISQRRTYASGTSLNASCYGPDVNSTYPIGSYLEDYEYVSGLGDLDQCNGRFGITPEFPNGIYAYFVTVDSSYTPVYPLSIGPYYYGTFSTPNLNPSYSGSVPTSGITKVFDNASNNLECQKLMFLFSLVVSLLIGKNIF